LPENIVLRPNLAAGIFVCALGVVVAAAALQSPLGTPTEMGPGFFPLALSCLLILLGLLVLFTDAEGEAGAGEGAVPWRGVALVAAAPLVFFGTVHLLGLALSIFVVSVISSSASRQARLVPTLLFSVALSALCTLVFVIALGLDLAILGTLFTGG